MSLATLLLLAIVALSLLLMLARPRGIAEVWWISAGVLLLLALRLVPLGLAARAVAQGTDVYLFLAGMMLLSELARQQGVFDWVAGAAVRSAHGRASRLFLLVYALGTLVTILLSNDATAVVLTPAILAAVRKARVAASLPYLFACALIANAASFVLPISNPANLVVFRGSLPPLGTWLAAFALPSLASIAVTYAVLRWLFRRQLRLHFEQETAPAELTAGGRLVLAGLALTVAVLLAASALKLDLGLPTCAAAALVAAVVLLRRRSSPLPLLRGISWSTLLLVAGLFVLVAAVESVGALRLTQQALAAAQRLGPTAAALAAGFLVGIGNNLVNNLPLGLLAGATLRAAHQQQGLLARAVLLGVDLGPNLSVTGSLATILWLLALRRERVEVSSWRFLQVGLFAMPAALAAALAAALLQAALGARG